MMTKERPYCQVAGCGSTTEVRAIEVDLVDSWEASSRFTTVTIHAALCASCAGEAQRRVAATLGARGEFYDLLHIIDAAVPYERQQREKLEQAEAEIERLELELSAARQQLHDTEAELRLARARRSLGQRRMVTRVLDEALNTGDGAYRP